MGFLETELYMSTGISTNQANDQKDLKKFKLVVEQFKKSTPQPRYYNFYTRTNTRS